MKGKFEIFIAISVKIKSDRRTTNFDSKMNEDSINGKF